ncbi:hypothetical protein MHN79_20690, partial [Vibrio sp. Of14-4]|uniref:hypothetical protein n=1 Tax=Vibrio sp. Of14-4 TaxID=2724878 RepID=UPI001EF26A0B
IDEASNKQSQAEQSVAANQAKVTALRAELETLSSGMQAQFDALNAQREAYDALQVSLAEHTTEVKARQRSLDSAWQSLSGKQAAENTASAALRTQQAQAQQWQAKLDAAKVSEKEKSEFLMGLNRDLTVAQTALSQRERDHNAAQAALNAAQQERETAQQLEAQNLASLLSTARERRWHPISRRVVGGRRFRLFGPRYLGAQSSTPEQLTDLQRRANDAKTDLSNQLPGLRADRAKFYAKADYLSMEAAYLDSHGGSLGMWYEVDMYREKVRRLDIQITQHESDIRLLSNLANGIQDYRQAKVNRLQLDTQVEQYQQRVETDTQALRQAKTEVRELQAQVEQAQQALNSARSNVAKANTQLTSANQAMDRAKASLSSATAEREAAEQLLSQASTHLSTAQTDKARVASELLAARTTLNQASTQFAKAHQSLSRTAQSLNQAGERLGSAIDLHAEVNVSLNQANRAQYQAKAAIDRAQGQVDIARYTAWRQASVEVASHDTDYEYDARGQLVTERSAVVSFADVQKDKPVTQFIGRLTTAHRYDSLGNVIHTTTAKGTRLEQTQRFDFDVQGHQVRSHGLAGSQVVFNDAGLASININAEGERRDKVYDAKGQLRFDVDELGFVTEYRYNAYGERIEQMRYANAYQGAREAGTSLSLASLSAFVAKGGDWRQVSQTYNARGERLSVTQRSSVDSH